MTLGKKKKGCHFLLAVGTKTHEGALLTIQDSKPENECIEHGYKKTIGENETGGITS